MTSIRAASYATVIVAVLLDVGLSRAQDVGIEITAQADRFLKRFGVAWSPKKSQFDDLTAEEQKVQRRLLGLLPDGKFKSGDFCSDDTTTHNNGGRTGAAPADQPTRR